MSGPAFFMICCILGDAHLQNLSFLRGLLTEFIFFNFSDTATYPRKLGNQKSEIAYFFNITFPRIAIGRLTGKPALIRVKLFQSNAILLHKTEFVCKIFEIFGFFQSF